MLSTSMKFRARMIEQLAVKKFYAIVVSMGKMAKMCVLRLTPDKVRTCVGVHVM